MERIMAILAGEREYASGLAAYLASMEGNSFKTVVFSTMEAYLDYAAKTKPEVLLFDEQFDFGDMEAGADICIMLTGEKDRITDRNLPTVFKYSPIGDLLAAVLKETEFISKKQELVRNRQIIPCKEEEKAPGQTLAVGVCSPSGGSYATSFSLLLADAFSRMGRTLYLSLDPLFSLPGEEKRATGKNLSELLFLLESSSEPERIRLSELTGRFRRMDYIDGVSHFLDICEMTQELAEKFCDSIIRASYDYLVIDLGPGSRQRLYFLEKLDYVTVTQRGAASAKKLELWKKQLQKAERRDILGKLKICNIPYERLLDGEPGAEELFSSDTAALAEKEAFDYAAC